MAITDSRLKSGSLTLTVGQDSISAACQAKNVSINPDQDGGDDRIEVLCGDVSGGSATAKDTLHIESIQDFTDPAGVQAWLWRNRGRTAEFSWAPDATTTPWTGKVTVIAPTVGGDVNKQLDYSIDLPILEHTQPFDGFGTGQIDPNPIVVITGILAPAPPALVWEFQPAAATLPGTLAVLKGHTVVGDQGASKPARDFTAGEYVLLGDVSKAHFATATGWAAGEAV
jgi:hypothetical protein